MKKNKGTTRKMKQTGGGGINLFGLTGINNNKEIELRKQADKLKEEIRPLFIIMENDIARKALNARMENGDVSAAQELYDQEHPLSMSTNDIAQTYELFDEKAKKLQDIMSEISGIDLNRGGKRKRRKTKKAK
jgi:hypothetical protein